MLPIYVRGSSCNVLSAAATRGMLRNGVMLVKYQIPRNVQYLKCTALKRNILHERNEALMHYWFDSKNGMAVVTNEHRNIALSYWFRSLQTGMWSIISVFQIFRGVREYLKIICILRQIFFTSYIFLYTVLTWIYPHQFPHLIKKLCEINRKNKIIYIFTRIRTDFENFYCMRQVYIEILR